MRPNKQGTMISNVALILAAFLLVTQQAYAFDLDIIFGKDKSDKNAPPDHAPAHGYRAKHQYRYYPSSQVYFDIGRGVYFHLSDGKWQVTASLPSNLKVKLGDHVSIEMDSDKPYTKHREHKAKYPPGQMKKLGLSSGKGNKGKGKGKYK